MPVLKVNYHSPTLQWRNISPSRSTTWRSNRCSTLHAELTKGAPDATLGTGAILRSTSGPARFISKVADCLLSSIRVKNILNAPAWEHFCTDFVSWVVLKIYCRVLQVYWRPECNGKHIGPGYPTASMNRVSTGSSSTSIFPLISLVALLKARKHVPYFWKSVPPIWD